MTLRALITRELRQQARQPLTWWIRCAGAAALLLVLWSLLADFERRFARLPAFFAGRQGAQMFGVLNFLVFAGLWLLGPLLTADSLSREKRDGTLGLLFLTPLRPWEIVTSKLIARGLHAAGLILAVTPVLAVPVLLGGVGWADAVRALMLNFAALTLALATGLLASTFCRRAVPACAVALALALGGLCSLVVVRGVIGAVELAAQGQLQRVPGGFAGAVAGYTAGRIESGWRYLTSPHYVAAVGWGTGANTRRLVTGGLVLLAALGITAAVVAVATRCVRRSWREAPAGPRVAALQHTFTRPRRWWYQRGGPRPAADAAEAVTRSGTAQWSLRLVPWVAGFALFWVTSQAAEPLWQARACAVAVVVVAAVAGALSFAEERRSGGLELLLTTPLPVRTLLFGRLRVVLRLGWPVLLGVATSTALLHTRLWWMHWPWADPGWLAYHAGMLLTALPVAGLATCVALWAGLRSRGIVWPALLGIGAAGLLFKFAWLPAVPPPRGWRGPQEADFWVLAAAAVLAVLGAVFFGRLFCRRLEQRRFIVA